jgi:hypothetical protein
MATIHSAVKNGNLNRVRTLLNQGVSVNSRDMKDWTPLFRAAVGERLNMVRLLLERGANVNARTRLNETPLHAAAASGHLNIVRELLQHGANINARNHAGMTPADSAEMEECFNIVRELARAARDPKYYKTYKTVKSVAKKFLMGPTRNVFLNKNGKPRNGNGPVNLNFNRGNYGIQYTRRWMSNGTNKSVRFYYSVPTFERLVGAKWSSIRHKAPTHVVLKHIPHLPRPKKDERQTTVYRRNLALVKFI